ncbi:UNVERIFIED_CONTAM: helix-turn-helix transcriptional regulator [Streptococcus canis]
MNTIKNRLRALRNQKGLTQDELVSELNSKLNDGEKPITKMTVSNWENNKHAIKPDKAQALADYFCVSVGYLLGYSTVKNKDEFISDIEKSDFFGDGQLSKESSVSYKELDLKLSFALLTHYHTEVESLLNQILGAYIEKDKANILSNDEVELVPQLIEFLNKQKNDISEDSKFLHDVLAIISKKYLLW